MNRQQMLDWLSSFVELVPFPACVIDLTARRVLSANGHARIRFSLFAAPGAEISVPLLSDDRNPVPLALLSRPSIAVQLTEETEATAFLCRCAHDLGLLWMPPPTVGESDMDTHSGVYPFLDDCQRSERTWLMPSQALDADLPSPHHAQNVSNERERETYQSLCREAVARGRASMQFGLTLSGRAYWASEVRCHTAAHAGRSLVTGVLLCTPADEPELPGHTLKRRVVAAELFRAFGNTCHAPAPTPPAAEPAADDETTVLVVEDEPLIRELLCRMLQRDGLAVVSAGTGDEALAVFNANRERVKAVLLDLGLPGRSARLLFDDMRRASPNLPVLAVTGYSLSDSRFRWVEQASFAAILQKPFARDRVLQEVRNALAPVHGFSR